MRQLVIALLLALALALPAAVGAQEDPPPDTPPPDAQLNGDDSAPPPAEDLPCPGNQPLALAVEFQPLTEALEGAIGDAAACAERDPVSGDLRQQTSEGLAELHASNRLPTFTVGSRHYALTARGLLFWGGDAAEPPAWAVLQFPTARGDGQTQCGAYTVRWSGGAYGDAHDHHGEIVISGVGGGELFRVGKDLAALAALHPLWCGDVLNDGSTVLAYTTFSGGAHCCAEDVVVLLGEPTPTLLDAALGNSGDLHPEQLDGLGAAELVGVSDAFAYFADLPFSESPALPLAYAFDAQQNRYVEATRRFPAPIQADYDAAIQLIQDTPADAPDAAETLRGPALRAYGDALLLGKGDAGLAEVQGHLPAGIAAWLGAQANEAANALNQRYAP